MLSEPLTEAFKSPSVSYLTTKCINGTYTAPIGCSVGARAALEQFVDNLDNKLS